jgi:hypothetical protein
VSVDALDQRGLKLGERHMGSILERTCSFVVRGNTFQTSIVTESGIVLQQRFLVIVLCWAATLFRCDSKHATDRQAQLQTGPNKPAIRNYVITGAVVPDLKGSL